MSGKLGRAAIVITLLATLLIPAAGSLAGSKEELEQVEDKLEQVRDRIDARAGEAGDLRAENKALDADIKDLRNEVTKLEISISKVESDVRSVQARIDATQARIDRVEEIATSQAVFLYKSGGTEQLDALLESKSLVELDDRAELLGVASQENTDVLIEYGRLKATIEDQNRELFAKKEELMAIRDTRKRSMDVLDQLYERNAANLAKLEKKLDELHHLEGDLQKDEQKLTGEILRAQAKDAVVSLGVSSGGFIWPLNGAINSYYGPRWGRMHNGLDIDGNTGDAVVATKSGRVISAGPYGGYDNAVVINHGGGFASVYAHLSSFAVSAGQDVSTGQIVGAVGCTGSCTGDHLHFEIRVNGAARDPLQYLP